MNAATVILLLVVFTLVAVLLAMLYELGKRGRALREQAASVRAECRVEVESLRESVQRFQGLVETLYDWVWEVDGEGRYTYVSPQVRNILGYEPDEVLGRTPFDLMAPQDAQRLSEQFEKLIRQRSPFVAMENLNVHKDGRLIVLETNGVPFYDSDGNFKGYCGTDRDITVRKMAEEALRTSGERLKEAQQIARLGNWELDLRTGRLIWSESIFQLFEIDPRQFEPSYEGFLTAVHPDDRQMIDEAYTESLKTRQPYEISHRLLMKDGRVKWVHEICRTEYDNEGNPVRSTGVVQDITKSKEAEEKIRHMANHDYLTDLPTMRLARDRLAMAINAARRYNEMVAVLFIDLDGFKAINDTYGHDVGDHVLKQVAKHLISGVRATSTVARAGGDEFLLIATELRSRDTAALVAEKVLRLVSLPVSLYDKEAVLTSSIGISLFAADGDDVDTLIKLADGAMYRAKNGGKNCYCFAGE